MTEATVAELTIDTVRQAVLEAAAFRAVTRLEPAGGPGDKVFPPTYQGGQYHLENRRVGDAELPTVVLDSVQSQANRMELARLQVVRPAGACAAYSIVSCTNDGVSAARRYAVLAAEAEL